MNKIQFFNYLVNYECIPSSINNDKSKEAMRNMILNDTPAEFKTGILFADMTSQIKNNINEYVETISQIFLQIEEINDISISPFLLIKNNRELLINYVSELHQRLTINIIGDFFKINSPDRIPLFTNALNNLYVVKGNNLKLFVLVLSGVNNSFKEEAKEIVSGKGWNRKELFSKWEPDFGILKDFGFIKNDSNSYYTNFDKTNPLAEIVKYWIYDFRLIETFAKTFKENIKEIKMLS